MYGIKGHYFLTLHDFNTLGGEELEAFLPEQALKGEVHLGSRINVHGRRKGVDLPSYRRG